MTNPTEFLETADAKQKAFAALCATADLFFRVAMGERAKDAPGPARAAQVLIEDGRASVIISIQFDREKLTAALALAPVDFVDTLSAYELKLNGPLRAAFADPAKVSAIDLRGMN